MENSIGSVIIENRQKSSLLYIIGLCLHHYDGAVQIMKHFVYAYAIFV